MAVWPSGSHVAAISSRVAPRASASRHRRGEKIPHGAARRRRGRNSLHLSATGRAHCQNCHLASGARSDRHVSGVARRLLPKAKTAAGVLSRSGKFVNAKYRCQFFSNLEVSVARCLGRAAGGRRAPGVAQRPTGARLHRARNRTGCLTERASARSARRKAQPTLNRRASR